MGSYNGQKHNELISGKYAHVNAFDVVFTPRDLARQIISLFPISGSILEPCKGEGAFLEWLPEDTEWCEITEGRNYYDFDKNVDWIVTNPPYSDFNRFLTHSFRLSENVVLLVPVAKIFKSMGTVKIIMNYGGIVCMYLLPASKAGFPFGFPCMVVHLKRGYSGSTEIKMMPELNPRMGL